MDYKEVKYYADVFSGYAFSAKDLNKENGIPVLKIGNIQNKNVLKDVESYYPFELSAKLEKFLLRKGDFLIAMTGAGSVGKVGKMKHQKEEYLVNQRVAIVRPNKNINEDFLFYFFSQNFIGEYLYIRGIGAGQPNISANDIKKVKVNFPNIQDQEKIATILIKYDKLIEINNKRITILEQMAEEIYKEWFVRINKRKNVICKKYITLEELGIIMESGSRPKGGIDSELKDGVPSLGAESINGIGEYDYNSTKYIPKDFYDRMKNGKSSNDDILIYKDGAYIGKTTLFRNNFPFEKYAVNEHVFLVRSKNKIFQNYLYFTLHQEQYFNLMQNLNRNAAQPGLSRGDINRIKIVEPILEPINKFNEIVNPIIDEIFKLSKINQNLIEQRDLLLPRLMSGKLEVK